jgi:hypothetical protein
MVWRLGSLATSSRVGRLGSYSAAREDDRHRVGTERLVPRSPSVAVAIVVPYAVIAFSHSKAGANVFDVRITRNSLAV